MALVFEVASLTASDETVSRVVSHTFTQRRRTSISLSDSATGVPDLWTESASGLTSSTAIPLPMMVKMLYGVLCAR